MHPSHISQGTIQNRNVHISVLNGALRDMAQVHCGICELGHVWVFWSKLAMLQRVHHGDVIKWKRVARYWAFVRGIHRSPVDSPHKGQWRGALMLSLICAWTSDWANNRDAGDLRRHGAHHDVTLMKRYCCALTNTHQNPDVADIHGGLQIHAKERPSSTGSPFYEGWFVVVSVRDYIRIFLRQSQSPGRFVLGQVFIVCHRWKQIIFTKLRRLIAGSRKVSKPRNWGHCCCGSCQFTERFDKFKPISHSFETLRDLAVRRIITWLSD